MYVKTVVKCNPMLYVKKYKNFVYNNVIITRLRMFDIPWDNVVYELFTVMPPPSPHQVRILIV